MGDKVLEQIMILTIKENFFRPMYYRAPIENAFYLVSLFMSFYANIGKNSCRLD
jgi:hypothetical protein